MLGQERISRLDGSSTAHQIKALCSLIQVPEEVRGAGHTCYFVSSSPSTPRTHHQKGLKSWISVLLTLPDRSIAAWLWQSSISSNLLHRPRVSYLVTEYTATFLIELGIVHSRQHGILVQSSQMSACLMFSVSCASISFRSSRSPAEAFGQRNMCVVVDPGGRRACLKGHESMSGE
jgi:hypothetical protein